MQNELSRVGMWLVALKKGRYESVDNAQLQLMTREFGRITDRLMNLWVAKEKGLEYLMEFHQAEGFRLLEQIGEADRIPKDGMYLDEKGLFRLTVCNVLYNGLCKLLDFLATLQIGPDLWLDLPGIDVPD